MTAFTDETLRTLLEQGMFLHGTRRGFTSGGVLFPRSATGGAGTNAPLNPGMQPPQDAVHWCYITRDLNVAWAYAHQASGRGAPKVLVVAPYGTVERDPEHGPRTDAWRCEWAKVAAVMKAGDVEPILRAEHGADFDPAAYTHAFHPDSEALR